jgi:arylsulfatase A-like enzyme
MVSKLDESIGEIVEALEDKKMLKDTIIVFMSDNGAPSARNGTPPTNNYPNWGSNYPFRGVNIITFISLAQKQEKCIS